MNMRQSSVSPLHSDAVADLRTGLIGHLAHPVHVRIPADRPTTFVLINRTGGVAASRVSDRPTITVEAWSDDMGVSHDLIQSARQAVHRICSGEVINDTIFYRADEFSGPGYLPDPTTKQHRHTMSFSIHTRRKPAPNPDHEEV